MPSTVKRRRPGVGRLFVRRHEREMASGKSTWIAIMTNTHSPDPSSAQLHSLLLISCCALSGADPSWPGGCIAPRDADRGRLSLSRYHLGSM